jgi:hypothetical protein
VQGRSRCGTAVRGCGTTAWSSGAGHGGARRGGRTAVAAGRDGDLVERRPATNTRGAGEGPRHSDTEAGQGGARRGVRSVAVANRDGDEAERQPVTETRGAGTWRLYIGQAV